MNDVAKWFYTLLLACSITLFLVVLSWWVASVVPLDRWPNSILVEPAHSDPFCVEACGPMEPLWWHTDAGVQCLCRPVGC